MWLPLRPVVVVWLGALCMRCSVVYSLHGDCSNVKAYAFVQLLIITTYAFDICCAPNCYLQSMHYW
jgi:hypothetical protein